MCGLLLGRESARAGLRCYALIQAASSASAPPKRPLNPRGGARTGPATSRSRSLKLERDERTTLEERGRPLHPRPCSQTKAHMSANLPSARARAAARPPSARPAAARPASARSSTGGASVRAPTAKPTASVRGSKAAPTPSRAAASKRPVAAPAKPPVPLRPSRQPKPPPPPDAAWIAAKALARAAPRPLPCTAAPERMDLTGGLIDELLGLHRSGIEAPPDSEFYDSD